MKKSLRRLRRNCNAERQYESLKYYETHETQKEQYAYGQYQQAFSRVYKDACKNIKERNYPEGLMVNFANVATDVDELFKSAMYVSGVYDNDKNKEIVQKCSYGALSTERLAAFAAQIDGDDWRKEQHSDAVWSKQSDKAKKIITGWNEKAQKDKQIDYSKMIKETLETNLKNFDKGVITKKQLLDYMIAGEAYKQSAYPTNFSKLVSFIQYNRINNALNKCRSALGLSSEASLRVAMNEEYSRIANTMTKEQIFKSIEKKRDYTLGFSTEKLSFEKEHKYVQDREMARRQEELEKLKAAGKEPISISELDERKLIVNQGPRVKPIVPVAQPQQNLSVGTGR